MRLKCIKDWWRKDLHPFFLLIIIQIPFIYANSTNSKSDDEYEEVLSRHKRFLYYTSDRRLALPPNSGLGIDFKVNLPFQRGIPQGITSGTNLGFPFGFSFDELRWTSTENPYLILPFAPVEEPVESKKRKKRHLPYGGDRRLFYQMVEDYLYNLGMDGQSCLLRAICEAHELPFYSQGFFGEALRLLLTASLAPDIPESMDVYLEAEKLGSSYQDCSLYLRKCHHTLFSSRNSNVGNKTAVPQGRVLYYTTDRRITFPPGSNGYLGISFFINNFRGSYTGTSLSLSITTGASMDFDALYLTSPEHPWAPIEDAVVAARKKRNVAPDLPAVNRAGGDRELMYPVIEEHLSRFGLDGKGCLLRAICEAHEKPVKNYNFVGEIFTLFLRPSKSFKPEKRLWEYIEAEKSGRRKKDCRQYYKKCPKSFFKDEPRVPRYDFLALKYLKPYLEGSFTNTTKL